MDPGERASRAGKISIDGRTVWICKFCSESNVWTKWSNVWTKWRCRRSHPGRVAWEVHENCQQVLRQAERKTEKQKFVEVLEKKEAKEPTRPRASKGG